MKIEHKTSNVKKSPKIKNEADKSPKKSRDNTIKSYLVPPSYPNQGVVYVKKSIRENELFKLNSLKEDLHNVKVRTERCVLCVGGGDLRGGDRWGVAIERDTTILPVSNTENPVFSQTKAIIVYYLLHSYRF